jgi:hypothetical protein
MTSMIKAALLVLGRDRGASSRHGRPIGSPAVDGFLAAR